MPNCPPTPTSTATPTPEPGHFSPPTAQTDCCAWPRRSNLRCPGPHRLAGSRFGACGTVLIMSLDDLPDWLPAWCLDHLGAEPADVLFRLHQVSMVFGLRLAGGSDVVVKARADDGRAVSWVSAQAQ